MIVLKTLFHSTMVMLSPMSNKMKVENHLRKAQIKDLKVVELGKIEALEAFQMRSASI